MDNMSDPLPAGTRMWIRKLSLCGVEILPGFRLGAEGL